MHLLGKVEHSDSCLLAPIFYGVMPSSAHELVYACRKAFDSGGADPVDAPNNDPLAASEANKTILIEASLRWPREPSHKTLQVTLVLFQRQSDRA